MLTSKSPLKANQFVREIFNALTYAPEICLGGATSFTLIIGSLLLQRGGQGSCKFGAAPLPVIDLLEGRFL